MPEPAPRALVGERGVREAVHQHDVHFLQQRQQQLLHELGACGRVEQRFGLRGDVELRVGEQVAKALGEGDAARLAHELRVDSPRAQRVVQSAGERGLARAVDALDRDQHAFGHGEVETESQTPSTMPPVTSETVGETWAPAAAHPHAAAVLGPAVQRATSPSHSYLFHGPAGSGKRALAREFAAALLAEGASSPDTVAERVARESHPDLTWVRASGAAEMLVGDIDEAVVAAASMTPFESARRVFVIEGAERMNDQAANRLLKTLEEPPPFAHLILITDRPQDVLATIASRCQRVRFDPPPPETIEASLRRVGRRSMPASSAGTRESDPYGPRVRAAGAGRRGLARLLASEQGEALRAAAETFVRSSLAGETAGAPWKKLLDAARGAGTAGRRAGRAAGRGRAGADPEQGAQTPPARRHRSAPARRAPRAHRDARAGAAPRGALAARRALPGAGRRRADPCRGPARAAARTTPGRTPVDALPRAIELVGSTRLSLAVNVSEELALEALAYELAALAPHRLTAPRRSHARVNAHAQNPSKSKKS